MAHGWVFQGEGEACFELARGGVSATMYSEMYLPKLDFNNDFFKLPYVSKLHNLLLIDMFHFVYRDSVKMNFCRSTRTDLSPNEGIDELCTRCSFRRRAWYI